jgi:aryl-alcohol dehydrogenase-like predicted oxidoreductase
MQHRFMGKTGVKVSEICLGAMTFGREADEAASFAMMDAFAAAGGNFIDTADVYSRGLSETIVGKWLKTQNRDHFVIATKVRFGMGNDVNQVGSSRRHIIAGVEDSLRRLDTDYIDLYQLHCWDPRTDIEQSMATLNGLVQQGKVRYIGISNFKAYQIQKAQDIARAHGWEPLSTLQPLYNLLDRSLEWEIVELCQIENIGIIPWSPLRGGWLTGKYRRGMETPPDETRVSIASKHGWSENWETYNTERTWSVIDTLLEVAEAVGKTPAQVALNWVKDRPGVLSPIVGARSVEQLVQNLGAAGWELPADQRQKLDEISALRGPYPYDFIQDNGERS